MRQHRGSLGVILNDIDVRHHCIVAPENTPGLGFHDGPLDR